MTGGSLQLREYPDPIVRLSCEKCGRVGRKAGSKVKNPKAPAATRAIDGTF